MEYERQWGIHTPGCVIILVDQSAGAVGDRDGGESRSTAEEIADEANRVICELGRMCRKGDRIVPRVHLSVLGYADGRVAQALPVTLARKDIVPINEVFENPLRIRIDREERYDPDSGEVVEFDKRVPLWIEPAADGGRTTCAAFRLAAGLCATWISHHAQSYPPLVLNMTTGDPDDGDLQQEADALRRLATDDGNVLIGHWLFTVDHNETLFPSSLNDIESEHRSNVLFNTASTLPAWWRYTLGEVRPELQLGETARFLVVNGNPLIEYCATYVSLPASPPAFGEEDIPDPSR